MCDGIWLYYVYKFYSLLNNALVLKQNLNVFCAFTVLIMQGRYEAILKCLFQSGLFSVMYQIFYMEDTK